MKVGLGCSLAALALFAMPAVAATAEGRFERTLQVTGAVDLEVKTGSGNINVRNGDAGSVRVVGTIRARDDGGDAQDKVKRIESNPPIEQNGNTIHVGQVDDREMMRNVSISYEVIVPAETRLRSQTGSGGQTIDGLRGPVEASTGSGNINVSRIADEVRASTGSGSVHLDSVKGRVRATTGSGDIRGTGIGGALVASTGSGSVRVEQTSAGGAEVQTGSGNVEVAGVRGPLRVHSGSGSIRAEGEPAGEWNLEVASGNIALRFPSQAAFNFRARTGSGRISIDHPLLVQGSIGRREVEGKVRGGGSLVSVRTASGNIQVQ